MFPTVRSVDHFMTRTNFIVHIYSDANKREKRRQTLFSILRDVFISTTYFMSSTFFYTNCVFYMYFRIIGYCILAFVLCLVSRHFPQIHIFSFRANQVQGPYTPISDHHNYRNLPMIHNLCLTCIPLVVYQTRKMKMALISEYREGTKLSLLY